MNQINIAPDPIEVPGLPEILSIKNMIVFDDDKFYCMLFKQNIQGRLACDFATTEDTFFQSLDLHHYDLAIVDYDLHSTNALKIAGLMKDNFDLPLVIISSSLNNLYKCQPQCDEESNIFGVISKWEEPELIVKKALKYIEGFEPLAPGLHE